MAAVSTYALGFLKVPILLEPVFLPEAVTVGVLCTFNDKNDWDKKS